VSQPGRRRRKKKGSRKKAPPLPGDGKAKKEPLPAAATSPPAPQLPSSPAAGAPPLPERKAKAPEPQLDQPRGKRRLNVIGPRRWWYALSGTLTLLALVSILVRGFNYSIDFTGGTQTDVRFEQPARMEDIRKVLAERGLGKAVITAVEERGATSREFIITTRSLSEEERQALIRELGSRVGRLQVMSSDSVTPVIGAELKRKAIIGVFLATLGILAYIALRFEWRFGIAALVALIHDVLITVGLFSLFQLPLDTAFIAAVLTVYGYSVMDTIVIFDRIRENLAARREDLAQVINRSVTETLTRSINTTLSTLLAIGAVLLFGGRTTKDLALALTVGIASGAYSSIFVASPIYYELVERLGKRKKAPAAAARTA